MSIADQDINIGPNSSYSISFYAYTGDTLIFSAWVVNGNDISYYGVYNVVRKIPYNCLFTIGGGHNLLGFCRAFKNSISNFITFLKLKLEIQLKEC